MAENDKPVVRFDVNDGIGVITIDYPPVNALGPGVGDGIIESLDKGEADPNVKAFVLIGAGRTFIAGADIKGFGKGRPKPKRRTYDALDPASKPIVAAIHGYALGGGLENALACHYRIAVPSAKIGLPEVLIGVIPGGGGTQRLPRIVGPKTALDLIVSGRHVPAPEAKELGIVDEIVPGDDLLAEAIAFAKKIADVRPLPRVRDRSDRLAEATPEILRQSAKRLPGGRVDSRRLKTQLKRLKLRCLNRLTKALRLRRRYLLSWNPRLRLARCATHFSRSVKLPACRGCRETSRRQRSIRSQLLVPARWVAVLQ